MRKQIAFGQINSKKIDAVEMQQKFRKKESDKSRIRLEVNKM